MTEGTTITDFSGEAFAQHRDSVVNLIESLSELYIDSEEEKEFHDVATDQCAPDDVPLPPPPLEFHEERLQFDNEETSQSMSSIEEHLADLEHRVSGLVTMEATDAKF